MALHRAPQHCAADWHAAPSTRHAPTPELEDKTPPDPPSDDDTPRLDAAAVDDAPVEDALDDEADAEVAAVLDEDEGQAPHVPLQPLSPHVPAQLGWQPPGCWQVMPWPVEGKQAHPAWVRQSASAEHVARQRSPALVLVQDAPCAQVLPGPHGVAHSPPGNPVRQSGRRHTAPRRHTGRPPGKNRQKTTMWQRSRAGVNTPTSPQGPSRGERFAWWA